MNHLSDLSATLPNPQRRFMVYWALMNASAKVPNKDARTEFLLRLVSELPQYPVTSSGPAQGLMMQALRLGGRRGKAVIDAIRENAEAITPDFVELRARCDQMSDMINAGNAPD